MSLWPVGYIHSLSSPFIHALKYLAVQKKRLASQRVELERRHWDRVVRNDAGSSSVITDTFIKFWLVFPLRQC